MAKQQESAIRGYVYGNEICLLVGAAVLLGVAYTKPQTLFDPAGLAATEALELPSQIEPVAAANTVAVLEPVAITQAAVEPATGEIGSLIKTSAKQEDADVIANTNLLTTEAAEPKPIVNTMPVNQVSDPTS